jgi:anti-anti-sigma factor
MGYSSLPGAGEKFSIEFMRTAGTVVLQLAGRLDESTTLQFEREANYWMDRGERTLVLDMGLVNGIRKEGVRSILKIGQLLAQAGGNLVLCGLSGSIGYAFRTYRADGLFETFEDVEEFESRMRCQILQ